MEARAVLRKMRLTENPDKLIEAVKKRPVLYSRYHPQFTDRITKKDSWYEVCAEITPHWSELARGPKGEVAQEVKRRWRTLRDGFSRELVFQKQDRMKRAKGEYVRRRKIYTYYNHLKFLLKEKRKREGYNEEELEDDEEPENSDSNHSEASNTRDSSDAKDEVRDDPKVIAPFKIEPGTSAYYVDVENLNETKGFDNQTNSFSGLDMDKTIDDDEDRLFCLSLVTGLKKMTEKQKYNAKIRIMQVLSEVRFNNSDS